MRLSLTILLATLFTGIFAQDFSQYKKHINPIDSIQLINLPQLSLADNYKGPGAKDLPVTLNNSNLPYFRPIFSQLGWSCGQASTIGYQFTYEINRVRNTSADLEENQFVPQFSFNFYNDGESGDGVNYMHSLHVAKNFGNPNVVDFGGMGENQQEWMTGYDQYYNSMKNRIDEIYTIHVGDEEGLQTLKYWMYDHLDGSEFGGIANFYTDLYGAETLPAGTPEEGSAVITEFGPYSGHSMTFLGWNDSIRWDYNNDGQYTNHLDINNDGEVNMKDWEIGGVILANSWGDNWEDDGFCYVMYNVLAKEKLDGGIWNKQVNVMTVKEDYSPLLTYKVTLKHTSRNKLKVMAGVSTDVASTMPEHTIEFPIFSYQGGDLYMQGDNSLEEYKTIEFALDATPLLGYIEPGEAAKFFLQVIENDPINAHQGQVISFSLMDYTDELLEIPCPVNDTLLTNNGITNLSVDHSLEFDKVNIETEELPAYIEGEPYSYQLTATGGTEPYTWEIEPGFTEVQDYEDYPVINGSSLTPTNNQSGFAIREIEFPFPFYGTNYDTVYVHVDGYLMFDNIPYPLPYQRDDLYLFKNIINVAPLANRNLYVTSAAQNGLFYEGDENHAAFRWIAKLETEGGDIEVDFTSILYPDGTIEYYYAELENLENEYKIIGISMGNNINFELSSSSNIFPKNDINKISWIPENYPHEYSIDDEGILHFNPAAPNTINHISIKVTDYNEIPGIKTFQLSDGLVFNYELMAGDNDIIEYGDTLKINMELKNISNDVIHNISLMADVNSNFVTMENSQAMAGDLAPGENIVLTNAISIIIHSDVPDLHNLLCELEFNSDDGNWEGSFDMVVYAPVLVMEQPIIEDGENNRLDPGETAELILNIVNSGHADAYDILGELLTSDPYITIETSNQLDYGNVGAGGTATQILTVSASEDTPAGHEAHFQVEYQAWPDIVGTYDFELLIGRFPVFIIDLDPDTLSAPIMREVISDLDIMYGYDVAFPEDLDFYDNIIVSLGRKWSKYELSEYEGQQLADYLNNGGNLYMEGGETWSIDPQTPVHPMFNLDVNETGYFVIPPVEGVLGSFAEDMLFDYDAPIVLSNYSILPVNGAFNILRNAENGNSLAVGFENETYKTIGTNFDFGGLIDSNVPSTKKYLMAGILNFFGMDINLISVNNNYTDQKHNILSCIPNPVSESAKLNINLHTNQEIKLHLYDIHGNLLKPIMENTYLAAGSHFIDFAARDLSAGIYYARLLTDTDTFTVKIIVNQ